MKSVLISIKPQWCELIASGQKTVEVRKTKPRLETPFKVYIYETQGSTDTPFVDEEGHYIFKGRGEVIGEFVCDHIEEIGFSPYNHGEYICKDQSFIKQSCVPFNEMFDYLGEEYGYGWHITDLVIYDKPRDLIEFCRNGECSKCGWLENGKCYKRVEQSTYNNHRVKRPPQSWCYVEGRANDET